MFISILNDTTWAEYQAFFTGHGAQPPAFPKEVVFVSDDEGLCVGVCLYNTDGPYMMLEHLTYDPEMSPKEGAAAIGYLAKVVAGIAAQKRRIPFVLTPVKGIVGLLESLGWETQPVKVLSYQHVGQPPPEAAKPTRRRRAPEPEPPEEDGGFLEDQEEAPPPPPPKRRRKGRPGNNPPRQSRRAPESDFE